MTFLYPEFLYFMLPPLFVLFGLLLTQKESQAHFFSEDVMSRLRVSANTLTLRARNALFLLMGVLMIVSLAQPVINDGVIEVKAKSADIMIAFDISDSMLATDVYPNRLELAKQKAMELLKIAPNERIGVIAFAKNSYLVSPMSFDHSAVGFLLRQLDTSSITEKGTDFLSMLEVVDRSIKTKSKKYLLIISDGGDSNSFKDEIAYAKEKNIVVFVLGVGTKKGAPIKREDGTFIKYKGEIIVSKLNDNISDLATSTGGVYIQNLKSNDDIEAMLSEIEAKSEQKELKSEKVHRYIPLFYYPLGVALLLLLIATSSLGTKANSNIAVFVLISFMFITPHAKAGMFDFMELNEAKKAYKAGEFERSAKLYQKYAESSGSSQSHYNAGNSFYKLEEYDKAIDAYSKATFESEDAKAKKLANIGNAYAKKPKQEQLQEAIDSYEASLKIKEDKEVRENLEEVKKLLKKNKQKEENKQEKKGDKKENQDKKKKDDKDGDSKESDEKSKDEKDSSKSEKSQDDKQNSDDMKSKKEEEKEQKQGEDDNKTKKQQKQDLEKLDKDEDNKSISSASTPKNLSKDKMSDAEEVKWLQQLNLQKRTYLYKLNEQKPKEENLDEKPW
ncbi:MAG: VWA domain-containing protein [Campylobacterota bacterium]|nr:VWA domain-containing protein [Campylobacterota bacterium]